MVDERFQSIHEAVDMHWQVIQLIQKIIMDKETEKKSNADSCRETETTIELFLLLKAFIRCINTARIAGCLNDLKIEPPNKHATQKETRLSVRHSDYGIRNLAAMAFELLGDTLAELSVDKRCVEADSEDWQLRRKKRKPNSTSTGAASQKTAYYGTTAAYRMALQIWETNLHSLPLSTMPEQVDYLKLHVETVRAKLDRIPS